MKNLENVVVYTKPHCPNCIQLKNLLEMKGVDFKVVELDFGQETTNPIMKIVDFKEKNPQVSAMPFFTAVKNGDVIQGGLMVARNALQ